MRTVRQTDRPRPTPHARNQTCPETATENLRSWKCLVPRYPNKKSGIANPLSSLCSTVKGLWTSCPPCPLTGLTIFTAEVWPRHLTAFLGIILIQSPVWLSSHLTTPSSKSRWNVIKKKKPTSLKCQHKLCNGCIQEPPHSPELFLFRCSLMWE